MKRRSARARTPELTGMEEVLEHEATIRARLPRLKGELRERATRIMRGRPKVGTRLDALRRIAREVVDATA